MAQSKPIYKQEYKGKGGIDPDLYRIVGVDSGNLEEGGSGRFREHYQIQPNFDINCCACCWAYLVRVRRYSMKNFPFRWVVFGNALDLTSCYVDGPQGTRGLYGVVKTGHDLNEGYLRKRPVSGSISYQLYSEDPNPSPTVALGQPVTARIEAIAMPGFGRDASVLNGCYLNYADAALLELYRESKGKRSFRGKCC